MTVSEEPTPIVPPQSRLGAVIRRNPIALKELRGRMRGSRAFIVLTGYVTLMSIFMALLYFIYGASQTSGLSTTGGVIGKLIFGGLMAVELFMVCFITPAFTAGAISGERERQTFNLLRTTLLPARGIVLGKLISAMAYIVLLLFVAVPLQSLAFLMGGISLGEVLVSVELLVITAMMYGTMGLFFSAVMKRTLAATIVTYVITLVTVVALPLLMLVLFLVVQSSMTFVSGSGLQAGLNIAGILLASTNPLGAALISEIMLQDGGSFFIYQSVLNSGAKLPLPLPWILYTVFGLLMTLLFVRLTVQAVRKAQASD